MGRGPLAGPVTVCLVVCEENQYRKLKANKSLPVSGKDSKKIKEKEREKYSNYLKFLQKERKVFYSINHISNKIIDSKGISFSIRKAIDQGIRKLNLNSKNTEILLDGSLKAPKEFKQKTIIKGDEKEKIIAWASILAKVSRDSLVAKMSKKYPEYGLDVNKGYGTLKHRLAIKKNGLSDFHRFTFCSKSR